MTRLFPTLLLTLLATNPAVAQNVQGSDVFGAVRLQHFRSDPDIAVNEFEGSLGARFGSTIIQLDVANWGLAGENDNYSGWGLHVGYTVGDDLILAGFLTTDGWDEVYRHIGVEAVYDPATPLKLDGALGSYTGPDYALTTASFDATYDFGRGFSATGSFAAMRGDKTSTVVGLGASYAFDAVRVDLEARKFLDGEEQTVLGLSVTYSFGGKEVFKPRKWIDLVPTE